MSQRFVCLWCYDGQCLCPFLLTRRWIETTNTKKTLTIVEKKWEQHRRRRGWWRGPSTRVAVGDGEEVRKLLQERHEGLGVVLVRLQCVRRCVYLFFVHPLSSSSMPHRVLCLLLPTPRGAVHQMGFHMMQPVPERPAVPTSMESSAAVTSGTATVGRASRLRSLGAAKSVERRNSALLDDLRQMPK